MRPSNILDWLTHTMVICGFFVAMVLVGIGFYFVQQGAGGGPLLDQISNGNDAAIRLAEMSPEHRRVHLRGTVGLDTLYPITYFGFFGGLAARLAGTWRAWALMPAGFTAVFDYIENTVQAMALAGHPPEVLLVKDIVTPLKFGGLMFAVVLMLILVVVALVRRVMRTKENEND
ncbi:MAG: hypothetical protein ABJG15_00625 [Hyphomonadaceae bacterium]